MVFFVLEMMHALNDSIFPEEHGFKVAIMGP